MRTKHTPGPSGISRETKFRNRERKAQNRNANLSSRSSIQSSGKTWHGAINGTPKAR